MKLRYDHDEIGRLYLWIELEEDEIKEILKILVIAGMAPTLNN